MGSTHVVEELSFSKFPSILRFDFDLILGSFIYFLGLWKGSKTLLGSTHVVEQLSFSMLLSILIFDFDLILGSLLTFWGKNGLFLGFG